MDEITRLESIRGTILQGLKIDRRRNLSDVMIQNMLAGYGEQMTRDQIRQELCYLEGKLLIEIKRKNFNVWMAKLNSRGVDFLEGRIEVDGINLSEWL